MGDFMSYTPIIGAIQQGRAGEKAQRKAMEAQDAAQKKAEAQAIRQERISGMDKLRANQKTPNMQSLLSAARRPSTQGAASTMLTQPYGTTNTLG